MSTIRKLTATALAGAMATAIASIASAHTSGPSETEKMMAAGDVEMCYGVAMKGDNDCAGNGHSCAGMSTADYNGMDFKLVAKGTCVTMETPSGGMGTLEAM
jgi:uncharacterized membrane protein